MDPLSFSVYLKFFIGLTAIINPLGLLPVFVSLTSQQTPQERLRTNTTANFAVMVILWVSMFFGQIIPLWQDSCHYLVFNQLGR